MRLPLVTSSVTPITRTDVCGGRRSAWLFDGCVSSSVWPIALMPGQSAAAVAVLTNATAAPSRASSVVNGRPAVMSMSNTAKYSGDTPMKPIGAETPVVDALA
jgi:hypothetical protein